MSSGERPIGTAKGKRRNTEALCQRPPPPGPPFANRHSAFLLLLLLLTWAARCVFWALSLSGPAPLDRAPHTLVPVVHSTPPPPPPPPRPLTPDPPGPRIPHPPLPLPSPAPLPRPIPDRRPHTPHPVPLQVQKARTSTGRVVAYQELGIPLSYTLEASLCGGYGLIPAQVCAGGGHHAVDSVQNSNQLYIALCRGTLLPPCAFCIFLFFLSFFPFIFTFFFATFSLLGLFLSLMVMLLPVPNVVWAMYLL